MLLVLVCLSSRDERHLRLASMTLKYPARLHAEKLIKELAELVPASTRDRPGAIFLSGAPTLCRYDTDRELAFRSYLLGLHPSH